MELGDQALMTLYDILDLARPEASLLLDSPAKGAKAFQLIFIVAKMGLSWVS